MRIRWTPAAASDLTSIYEYLREHEPHLAQTTVIEIRQAVSFLKTLPNRGRKGREEGTRELLHQRLPQIIAYRVNTPLWKSCISGIRRRTDEVWER